MTRRYPAALAGLVAIALIVGAVFWPRAAAAGWLAAFVTWASLPIGALGLLMIHRLVGGRWGEVARPALRGAAATIPLLWIGIIPIFVGMPVLFLWYGGGHARPDVLAHYLNWGFYVGRSVVILGGFTLLGVWIARGRVAPGLAAGGLIFFAAALTVAGLDWILSLRPETFFTGFGAATAMAYLGAALAWSVLVLPDMSPPVRDQMGALMIATLLGAVYFNYMDFLVIWYGDVAGKIAWFLPRSAMPWKPILAAALLFGAVIPLAALSLGKTRFLADSLRPAATSMLFGFAFYEMWQVLPPFGLEAVPFAVVAMAGIAALALTLLPRAILPVRSGDHE